MQEENAETPDDSTTGLPKIVGSAGVSLGAATVKATGIRLSRILHVDLLWTDLADFLEHFERDLKGKAYLFFGHRLGWWLWGDELFPTNPGIKGWELINSKHYTRIRPFDIGTTGRNYWVYDGVLDEGEMPKVAVQVVRFRRDRLKLSVAAFQESNYADLFRDWLEPRWGKGGKEGEVGIGYIDLSPNGGQEMAWESFLSDREREVLELLLKGYGNTQIGGQLIISPETVKSHKESISVKLGIDETSNSAKIREAMMALRK